MTNKKHAERVAEFLETVAECTKDHGGYLMTHPAQEYIQNMLAESSKNDRPSMLVSFAESVAAHFTGSLQTQARCFGTIIASFPETDAAVKARHALDKVGKSIGLTTPPGWDCKAA